MKTILVRHCAVSLGRAPKWYNLYNCTVSSDIDLLHVDYRAVPKKKLELWLYRTTWYMLHDRDARLTIRTHPTLKSMNSLYFEEEVLLLSIYMYVRTSPCSNLRRAATCWCGRCRFVDL